MLNVDLDFNPNEAEPCNLWFPLHTLAEAKK